MELFADIHKSITARLSTLDGFKERLSTYEHLRTAAPEDEEYFLLKKMEHNLF